MIFDTATLNSKILPSFDLKLTNEDKCYQMALYANKERLINEYNFMINTILPGILIKKFYGKDNFIYDVKGVEVKFPQINDSTQGSLLTPRICRMTNATYQCEIWIDYFETKDNSINGVSSSNINVSGRLKNRKIGSFHVLVGSNRCITSIKPVEFDTIDDWKIFLGECPSSPASYFIHKGAEKAIISDEKLRTNIYLTFITKNDPPIIETRITCINDSKTSILRLQIGKYRPTLKVLFSFIKGPKKIKHLPLYLVFYLLWLSSATTIGTYNFTVDKFEDYISSFAAPEHKNKILIFLEVSKNKFIELFQTTMKDPKTQKDVNIYDEEKIRKYLHHKMRNEKVKMSESDAKKFLISNICLNVKNEIFGNSKFQEKIANLSYMVCKTILCSLKITKFDSRDEWGMKKVDTVVRSITQYISDTLVEKIKSGNETDSGFIFGKSDKQASIYEARKCETINSAIGELDKIDNQVDTRTTSISLREVSQGQFPNVCVAKTPEGEKCGLSKEKSALSHFSYNQEYFLNRNLIFQNIFTPEFIYFSNFQNKEFCYKLNTINHLGQNFQLHFGLDTSKLSPENIYVSKRILNHFRKYFDTNKAIYYIDENTIHIRFSDNFVLEQTIFEINYLNGFLVALLPLEFNVEFNSLCSIIKNPNYKSISSNKISEECNKKLAFQYNDEIHECRFISKKEESLYISDEFLIELNYVIPKNLKKQYEIINDISNNRYIVKCNKILTEYIYEHWSGIPIKSMLPKFIAKFFWKLLGLINEFISVSKINEYKDSFMFNCDVVVLPTDENFYPKIIWVKGNKLLGILKNEKRKGNLPFDSCINLNERDNVLQYFDDSGRLMSPFLIVDEDGDLIIDKLNLWKKFEDRDFSKSKELIELLYSSGVMELVDAKEMDNTLLPVDISECRNISKLRKFLNSLDLNTIKSSVFEDSDGFFINEDINNIIINGNKFDVEFTLVKNDEFETFSFIQDDIVYYGKYTYTRDIYIPIEYHILKFTKPINGITRDGYHMYYILRDNEIYFITKDLDLETDGDYVYFGEDIVKKINYIKFDYEDEEIYMNEKLEIVDIKEIINPKPERMIHYKYNDEWVDSNEVVDNFININGKFVKVDEYRFDGNSNFFSVISEKISVYISKEEFEKSNIAKDESINLDECKLHMANIRRYIEEIDKINLDEDPFETLKLLKVNISLFGNKKTIASIRHYLNNYFKFTHCLIDPNSAFSIIANFVPKADSNPGPRFSYQCAMGTQALGVGNCVWYTRFETSSKRLLRPTEHPFETVAELPISQVMMPTTQNAVIGVLANRKGFEDAIVISKSFIRKFGRYEKEVTIKIIENNTGEVIEKVGLPVDSLGNIKRDPIYKNLDDNGLPKLNSYINVKDCILGKSKITIGAKQKVDSSYFAGIGEDGLVKSIRIIGSESDDNKSGNFRTFLIKLVQRRYQQAGDKMALRFSQKGTIADVIGGLIEENDPKLRIVDDNLMPFVRGGPNNGLKLEIIFNPMSFPSRMTCGLIKEILTSKASLYLQEKVDASSFHSLDIEKYRNALFDSGLDMNGNELLSHSDGEIMMDSTTGKPFKAFIGIAAYQFLRHHVVDKVSVRSTGPMKSITHQPSEGRKKGASQRVGGMELDSICASGAVDTVFDRFMTSSDGYIDVFCTNCGNNSAISPLVGKTCVICKTSGSLVSVEEPRIYNVFREQMNAIGLDIKQTFVPKDDLEKLKKFNGKSILSSL
jgi:DNA-directed RNA polymerase beta subunit